MEALSVVLLTALEQVLALIVGSLLVYLGYRLFIEIPIVQDGEGKFTLPNGAGVHLMRVGPGVFFSLFGTGIVVMALLNHTDYRESITSHDGDTAYIATKAYSGIGAQSEVTDDQELERLRSQVLGDIYILNTPDRYSYSNLSETKQKDLDLAIRRAKLAMMKSVWNEAWGSYVMFEAWALQTQGSSPPPTELAKAAMVFQRGQGEMER